RKIDAPGIGGVLAHLAEHEGAIAAAECAHAKAVEHAWIRKAPVAPCQKAREIGLEIAGAEAVAGKHRVAREQHATVPERGLFALLVSKIRRYLRSPRFGERPRP